MTRLHYIVLGYRRDVSDIREDEKDSADKERYAARLPDCMYGLSASDLAQNVKGVLPSNIGKVSLDKGRREWIPVEWGTRPMISEIIERTSYFCELEQNSDPGQHNAEAVVSENSNDGTLGQSQYIGQYFD